MRTKQEVKKECRRVNDLLKAQARRLKLGTESSLQRLSDCRNDPATFREWAELEFVEYCRRILDQHESSSANSLINGGASQLKLSPVTTKRYLSKLRSARGPLGGLGDVVMLNPNYVPTEEDDYWLKEPVEIMEDDE